MAVKLSSSRTDVSRKFFFPLLMAPQCGGCLGHHPRKTPLLTLHRSRAWLMFGRDDLKHVWTTPAAGRGTAVVEPFWSFWHKKPWIDHKWRTLTTASCLDVSIIFPNNETLRTSKTVQDLFEFLKPFSLKKSVHKYNKCHPMMEGCAVSLTCKNAGSCFVFVIFLHSNRLENNSFPSSTALFASSSSFFLPYGDMVMTPFPPTSHMDSSVLKACGYLCTHKTTQMACVWLCVFFSTPLDS